MKRVSFLATGNEIIQGDIQDTNGNYFARTLHDLGATIYQHVLASDHLEELSDALRYLLQHSDAVITVGGLGPTSDDNTRYAVSEVTGQPLAFHENSWQAITERFKRFNLKLVPSNRQQALFPPNAVVYPNENGSAPGCYLPWQDKHIFMLPGPPSECRPLFDMHIVPTLQQLSFFHKKEMFRWLTMGISESEIGEKIDALAKPKGFDTGFRWCYPYLEIKVISQNENPDLVTIDTINTLLEPLCVSRDRQDAIEVLEKKLNNTVICIINEVTDSKLLDHPKLIYANNNSDKHKYLFTVRSSPKINGDHILPGSITFSCQGYVDNKLTYEHDIRVPMRGSEVLKYAQAYLAWQLVRFIRSI